MVVCGSCGLPPGAQRKAFWLMLVLVLLSSMVVIIKERSFAREVHKLTPVLEELVPSSCVPNPQNDGLYVHLECPIRNSSTFYPPSNFAKNISAFHGVFFELRAEMFQYTGIPNLLFGGRKAEWIDHLISDSFWSYIDGSRNPEFFPHIPAIGRQLASGLRAGGYTLPGSFSGYFKEKQQLPLEEDGVYTAESSRPPRKVDSQSTLVYKNYLYTGNPLAPQIGDVRISFWGNKSTHVSLIGKQTKTYFGSGRTVLEAPADAKTGSPMTILAEGDYEPHRLVEHRLTQLGFPASFVWLWRFGSFLLFFFLIASSNCWETAASSPNPLPFWGRMLLSGLLALAGTLLQLAAGWWSVEIGAARRLFVIAAVIAAVAAILRLLLPRLLPPALTAEVCRGGKYYDLGVSLQVPGSSPGSSSRLCETAATVAAAAAAAAAAAVNGQSAQETRQGTVIRWTTTPALPPSPEDTIRRSVAVAAVPGGAPTGPAAAKAVEAPTYGTSYRNGGLAAADFGVYGQPPLLPTRAASITNLSLQKSSSKGSI